MAARKLTQQQQRRANDTQSRRRDRATQSAAQAGELLDGAELGPEQPGTVVARFGAAVEVEGGDGLAHYCFQRQNLPGLVTGDQVTWRLAPDGRGVVVALTPRRTELTRPTRSRPRAIAANIDQLLIVFAPEPAPEPDLIDRYLVSAGIAGMDAKLLLNKSDLLDETQTSWFDQLLELYRGIGYDCLQLSVRQRIGIEQMRKLCEGQTSIVVGQSGVGKSSLISALEPNLPVAVGAISEVTGFGRHTTSTPRLYHLVSGGDLIDSPGVRRFGLHVTDPALIGPQFPELAPYLGRCRFRDCSHGKEPDCALLQAVDQGAVDPRRLQSYLQMVADAEESRANAR
ncbi:MAG: small ribosomal subunit biogenesis GTPase RsgA [Gammaproteobacteria bacterium]|nr:small ribosomal subunit biogenesis GTPase RsgA [Gammaproteobacteria bacterium]